MYISSVSKCMSQTDISFTKLKYPQGPGSRLTWLYKRNTMHSPDSYWSPPNISCIINAHFNQVRGEENSFRVAGSHGLSADWNSCFRSCSLSRRTHAVTMSSHTPLADGGHAHRLRSSRYSFKSYKYISDVFGDLMYAAEQSVFGGKLRPQRQMPCSL